jgi:hypothetical protein
MRGGSGQSWYILPVYNVLCGSRDTRISSQSVFDHAKRDKPYPDAL